MTETHQLRRTVGTLFLSAILAMPFAVSGWAQSSNGTLGDVVSKMEQAQARFRDQSVPYTVTRRYELGTPASPRSTIMAQINFIPPSQKDYTLHKIEGNNHGTEIVSKVLAHEAEMATEPQKYEITSRNYTFALAGQEVIEGHNCYVLQLIPKRNEDQLVRGRAWVDSSDFMIRRVQGTPVKSPSWWLKNIEVTIDYAEIHGMWIQQATKAVADVRLMGTHVLTSQELDLRTADVSARNASPGSRPVRRPSAHSAIADGAVWVPR